MTAIDCLRRRVITIPVYNQDEDHWTDWDISYLCINGCAPQSYRRRYLWPSPWGYFPL